MNHGEGKTGYVRLHTLPRVCRGVESTEWNAQQRYVFDQSHARYWETENGKYLLKVFREPMHEVGSVESVRFIESESTDGRVQWLYS